MEEFDLKRFANTAYGKKWYIFCIMIISLILGYLYSFIYNIPKYKSETTIVLAQVSTNSGDSTSNSITQTDITMNKNLVDTYTEIIKSDVVLKKVKENLSLEETEDELYNMIKVTAGTNTELLTIEVSNVDPEFSQKITNEIAKVFSEKVPEIYNINNVYVLDEAELETEPYNINHPKDMVIAAILGMFISAGVILIIYMFDTTIKQEEDVEENTKLPVIGTIPLMESDPKKKRGNGEDIDMPVTESFRTLRTNLTFGKKGNQLRNILITSSYSSEGKSYVSSNLAKALARSNKKVLLIDADMRKGRQHKIFKVENPGGLSNCLEEIKTVNVNTVYKYIKTTQVPNLHIITSGDRPSNPSELISSSKMVKIIRVLNEIYDVVVIDGTPSMIVSDSFAIAKFVKNVIVVVAHKSTKIESLKKIKKSLENVGANIIGVVLNKYPIEESSYNESYYYVDESTGKLKKNANKEQKVQSVEDLIVEVQKNRANALLENKDNSREEQNEELKLIEIENEGKELINPNSDNYLYYKMENITQEISNIKNLFIQYAMNNKQMSQKELEDIKREIINMKEIIENNNNPEATKGIREEVESIRETTNSLIEEQRRNNEKIKKFLEDYRSRNKLH